MFGINKSTFSIHYADIHLFFGNLSAHDINCAHFHNYDLLLHDFREIVSV